MKLNLLILVAVVTIIFSVHGANAVTLSPDKLSQSPTVTEPKLRIFMGGARTRGSKSTAAGFVEFKLASCTELEFVTEGQIENGVYYALIGFKKALSAQPCKSPYSVRSYTVALPQNWSPNFPTVLLNQLPRQTVPH